MTNFVLYSRATSVTGKALSDALETRRGVRVGRIHRDITQVNTLIRWGNTEEFPLPVRNEPNTVTAIRRASDKLTTLRILSEAGISVPPFGIEPSSMNFPLMGRSRHGSGGADIIVYESPSDFREIADYSEFYTEYIPNRREYRVHVVNGEIVRVQGKWLDFPGHQSSRYVKNYTNGFRYRSPQHEINEERKESARRSVAALGLYFGAVDLLVAEDRSSYILEVNTAPGCSPMTLSAYANKFREMIQ